MPDIPDNAATALERVFWRVRQSGRNTVKEVWTYVLNAQAHTPEFAIRHAEVVHLVRRLQLYLLALPDDDQTRTRYEGDIVLWYSVVVHTGNWEANSNANATMISEDKINLLGSLGQILSYQSSLKPAPNVEMLKASLAEWATLLEEAELPPDLAAKIRAEIEQIEFLLSEAETYGLEPLAEHGRSLFGLGLSVIKVTGTVGTVVSAMSNLFQFITQVSVNDYGGAVNALAGVFSSVNDVFTLASEEAQQKAIAAKKQKELLAKPDEEPSEVIDGEVVDDSSTKPHI
ncbi:hypothetical protein MMAN_06470 [Mycobacterium mantenii]|uniref:ESX-1 secretion-associated protein EspA/EspE-like domain-containing protein n=1 Tax=Mycobacterium mantenii TaxID=560555 RepID=A0ABN6A0W5_MYCNT|nr:hypothetical protein [Mycobacterium mantenii]MCV7242807.1 hypothetical protein [Mycobacterium mantenii]BBY36513.1 hypothetical protein MMAN_06470 [Mycobacterium mantenii]